MPALTNRKLWLIFPREDIPKLLKIEGVKVLKKMDTAEKHIVEYYIQATAQSLNQMDPYWGDWLWGPMSCQS